jgi:hypothetical protein
MKHIVLFTILFAACCIGAFAQQKPLVVGALNGQGTVGSGNETRSIQYSIGQIGAMPSQTVGSAYDIQTGFPWGVVYLNYAFTKQLLASKGYYSDFVQLEWDVKENSGITRFIIYRKNLDSNGDSVRVAILDPDQRMWHDDYTEAGVLYKYTVYADGISGTFREPYINYVQGIGFRLSFGIINGHIQYSGGTPVADVRVSAVQSTGNVGASLLFNGENSFVSIPSKASMTTLVPLTVEGWVNVDPSASTDMAFFSKSYGSDGYILGCKDGKLTGWINGQVVCSDTFELSKGVFHHVALTYGANGVTLYRDGKQVTSPVSAQLAVSQAPLLWGKTYSDGMFFKGNIDEVRLWSVCRSAEQIKQDYSRRLGSLESGMIGYWRLDENFGTQVYDFSRTGTSFNRNDGDMMNVKWSTQYPDETQLGFAGITNSKGDYTINNLSYTGTGENFVLVPYFGLHKFEPTQRTVFVGDGNSVINNQDFSDISSFKVTGTVRYKDCSCYAKDIMLMIDGEVAVKDGEPIKTDASGAFTLDVPIGLHNISLKAQNHTFEVGIWPVDGSKHNFQNAVSGIEFIDSTLITIRGRVVGGTTEGNKKIGFNKSVNNIGQAHLAYKSEQGNGCFKKSVVTNAKSGEYILRVPPMRYLVDTLQVPSNLALNFGTLDVVDVSNALPLQSETDSVFTGNESNRKLVRVDSSYFHLKRNYVYRSSPELSVSNTDDTPLSGESQIAFTSNSDKKQYYLDLTKFPFKYPVFLQAGEYKVKIKAYEPYVNKDANALDPTKWVTSEVPVTDGSVLISNNLADSTEKNLTLSKGVCVYKFKASYPNLSEDAISPENSFSKTMSIKLTTASSTTTWPSTGVFRAYVFGSQGTGSNFYTNGPDVVDFVLRDPPGSGSSAYLEKGTSWSTSESFNIAGNYSNDFSAVVSAGVKAVVGMGFSTETEVEQSTNSTTTFAGSVGAGGDFTWTTTDVENFATSSDPAYVGADGDLFIGKAMNFTYGVANNLNIVPDSVCLLSGVKCVDGESVNGFRIALRPSLFIVPQGFNTMFMYSQKHIRDYLLPNIKTLRNNLFAKFPDKYHSYLAVDDENFGLNNDNTVWGAKVSSSTPTVTEYADYDGSSYKFTPAAAPNPLPDDYIEPVDSVRYYNQQIRLWEETLAANEKAKIEASTFDNVSLDAGTSYTKSHSSDNSQGFHQDVEVSLTNVVKTKIVGKVSNTGAEAEMATTIGVTASNSVSGVGTTTTTTGFTLADGDEGDYFSVDLKDSKGSINGSTIFATKGGQSSCPYEGATVSEYYNKGTVLSAATMIRYKCKLEVEGSTSVSNIPETSAATFKLKLTNQSETGDNGWYILELVQSSNPNGAVVKIDGVANSVAVYISSASSVYKTITIEKGTALDYENLQFMLHDQCYNYDWGQTEASSTVNVSAHFIPGCTPVSITQPLSQWVANSSNPSKLPIVIGDYNMNKGGFKDIVLQYKPVSGSTWYNLETFYKDTVGLNNPKAQLLSTVQPYVKYDWNIEQVVDGKYDLRALSQCALAETYSDIKTGLIDRVRPVLFGSPQPADGILSASSELSVQFNEPIYESMLTYSNFDIRGAVNGTQIDHNSSLFFDGASSYLYSGEGINLNNKSFTIELWARRSSVGEQCFVSQGASTENGFAFGFNADSKLQATFGSETVLSDNAIANDGIWHHYAFVFNNQQKTGTLYLDGTAIGKNSLVNDYKGSGMLFVGKQNFSNASHFNGNLHELRIWYKAQLQQDLTKNYYTKMSGKERGLAVDWQMTDAHGKIASDIAGNHHATLVGSNWTVEPAGKAISLNGADQYVAVASPAFTTEQDFTLEFWFNSTKKQNACLLSNGNGSTQSGWAIMSQADGSIVVKNNGVQFVAVDTNYFDGSWHHFALSVNRIGNISSFIDGKLRKTIESTQFGDFGGAKLYAGVCGYYNGSVLTLDNYFEGAMDEIRVWGIARKQEQISRFMNSRLNSDENEIALYLPFEAYVKDAAGIISLNPSLVDASPNNLTATAVGATYTADAPNIKLSQAVQKINYSYVTNKDKIVFTLTDPAKLIENCTLDITVKNVEDLNGNTLKSPITWSAYVNQNQLTWVEDEMSVQQEVQKSVTFKATIKNASGQSQNFSITNLPSWLSASVTSGILEPLSSKEIVFTVSDGLNIGTYNENIYLTSDFGFDEKLLLNLKVYKPAPAWAVNSSNYEYSMNVIGQIKINGILSANPDDMVAAFVGNECRGVAKPKYIAEYDMYEVYLDIYSKVSSSENVTFKIWNASEGVIINNVTPTYTFEANAIKGTPSQPVIFNAGNEYLTKLPLKSGWNWLSFNLASANLAKVSTAFSSVKASGGNLIKTNDAFDVYGTSSGWSGTITSSGGLKNTQMYMLKLSKLDTLTLTGTTVPLSTSLNIHKGWTWLSYLPSFNLTVGDAFASLPKTSGDVVKSQYSFAMYDERMGWIGSLTSLKPNEGYMYYSAQASAFTYPSSGLLSKSLKVNNMNENLPYNVEANQFEFNASAVITLNNSNIQFAGIPAVAAFVGNECRGVIRPVLIDGSYHYFLSICGTQANEKVSFAAVDDNNEKYVANEQLAFADNAIYGSIDNPVVLTFQNSTGINISLSTSFDVTVYPNPFGSSTNIDFNVPQSGKLLTADIYDVYGRKLETLFNKKAISGKFNFKWNSSLAYGVYFLHVYDGTDTKVIKLIKR